MYDMSISFTAFDEIAIIYLQITVKRLHQRVRELIFYEEAIEEPDISGHCSCHYRDYCWDGLAKRRERNEAAW
ncbi:hypothetical protein OKN5_27640 [Bacillus altitudinis]